MRAWLIRNWVFRLAAGMQPTRGMMQMALSFAECPTCERPYGGVHNVDALHDVEDELRCAADYLSEARAAAPAAADALTRAVGALVSARSSLFCARNPDADAADVHDALFPRGDA